MGNVGYESVHIQLQQNLFEGATTLVLAVAIMQCIARYYRYEVFNSPKYLRSIVLVYVKSN